MIDLMNDIFRNTNWVGKAVEQGIESYSSESIARVGRRPDVATPAADGIERQPAPTYA